MVLKMDAYRSNDGRLHETWEEAAAVDAIPIFRALGVVTEADAYRAAKKLFVDWDDEPLNALEMLSTLIEQKPRPVIAPNVVPIKPGETTQGSRFKMPKILGG